MNRKVVSNHLAFQKVSTVFQKSARQPQV